jgi:hypothetical protein
LAFVLRREITTTTTTENNIHGFFYPEIQSRKATGENKKDSAPRALLLSGHSSFSSRAAESPDAFPLLLTQTHTRFLFGRTRTCAAGRESSRSMAFVAASCGDGAGVGVGGRWVVGWLGGS